MIWQSWDAALIALQQPRRRPLQRFAALEILVQALPRQPDLRRVQMLALLRRVMHLEPPQVRLASAASNDWYGDVSLCVFRGISAHAGLQRQLNHAA